MPSYLIYYIQRIEDVVSIISQLRIGGMSDNKLHMTSSLPIHRWLPCPCPQWSHLKVGNCPVARPGACYLHSEDGVGPGADKLLSVKPLKTSYNLLCSYSSLTARVTLLTFNTVF